MAINPNSMRVVDVARLLNSTELGFVMPQAKIYRDFNRVGFRIAAADTPRNINLLKYIAWLCDQKHTVQIENGTRTYDERRNAERNRQADQSQSGRDIGTLPEVVNPQRKAMCERNFRLFCESYFSDTFSLEWSPDHLKVIDRIETAVLAGGLFALAMPRGAGKALALDTPLVTPSGWTTMGDVRVGDSLFDEQGCQCRVMVKSAVFIGHKCFRVIFDDGEEIICDANHLWQVEDRFSRKNPSVKTTGYLAPRYKIRENGYYEYRFQVPLQEPIQMPGVKIPFDPYSLGIWLGNGALTSSTCNADKYISMACLRADIGDRAMLLQGIMDSGGRVGCSGQYEIYFKYSLLADGFGELLSSLGIKYIRSKETGILGGKEYAPYQYFQFNGDHDKGFFQLPQKIKGVCERPKLETMKKSRRLRHTSYDVRTIVNIEEVPSVPTQCVMVDSPSHLFLAGRRMVPTHNSTLTETACLWSMLYGHREFVTLISSTESAALEMLDSIKTELEVNEKLSEDFPEVSFPIEQLEGIANRCAGQLCMGERTRITWTSNEIVLPTVKGSKASGIIVRVAGITGRIRGMKYKRSDGRSVRPSLVIIDDPQTSESAGSLEQTRKRVRVLGGDILGLAGPAQKISGIMPCTIIRPGDMADIILNRQTYPDWNGEKTKMVYKFPLNTKLWEEYAEIRGESLRAEGNFRAATKFYLANREAMDAGAEVSWAARFNHDEISALQHAMNLKFQDEVSFQSEYQNDPLPEDSCDDQMMSVDEIAGKVSGLAKSRIPIAADKVTMFIDVQKALLFYTVVAWTDDFTGAVIDYGAWPDQRRKQFSLGDANPTIQSYFPNAGFEGALYAALTALTDDYFAREWEREDGAMFKIEKAMIDANWGQSTDIVYQFCRQSTHAGILLPSHGRYVGAGAKPMTEYKKRPGDRLGLNWMIPNVAGKRAIRHVIYDTNFWKSFIHSRLTVKLGDKGNLSFYGRLPLQHQLMAEHLTAEYRIRTSGMGRSVDEWKLKPKRDDNHWFDCMVGCAVCASMLGASLPEFGTGVKVRKAPIRLSGKRTSAISTSMPGASMTATVTQTKGKLKLSALRAQKQ